jgi:hypothetical protein
MSSAKERTGIQGRFQQGMSFVAFNLVLGASIKAGHVKRSATLEEVSGYVNDLLKARGFVPVKAHLVQSFFTLALAIKDLWPEAK